MISRRVLFGSSGAALLPSASLGQTQVNTQPTTLEELAQQVADLEERVAELESKVGPAATDETENLEEPEVSSEVASGQPSSISGVGTTLSDPLYLEEGLYRVDAIVSITNGFGDFFNLDVAGSDDLDDWIFMEFAEGNGEFEYSTNWTAKRSEEYYFQIDCRSSWTVSFVKLR